MGNRRLAREHALQTLYYADTGKTQGKDINEYKEDFKDSLDAAGFEFCSGIIDGALEHQAELDKIISAYAKNWSLNRMSVVDRSILRMAAYEMLFSPENTPVAAVIDEAIELAKKFSTENSSRFINGLLDQIKKERKNGQN
ncbi:NusB anti-termination factor [Elusimicrobium minutum Pei191]|uniref:Transcription antitermination protein NusB n=1 Tax=Elusimicrobium minutum (strain Pei191) TaxID=445932 RepID=NUSB_ELUMP|nr:transcription antitermination factor NusB [Elusimicrobium minutum]B2KE32.1 RecName: Full=Transcription antitermination protein NusB; AltName: Full=Antitermination factor NusB [Elusimicrobium minutum Pei191]ACC98778.1 NusB anti-termination factor [Elusimicrobium minutum Pei191]